MNEDWENLSKPNVGFSMYWKEVVCVLLAILAPFLFYFLSNDSKLFAASGSITVFFSVLAEFLLLNKANRKHITNALRAKAGKNPNRFSVWADTITIISLVVAAGGTLIWGFGDRMFC